MSNYAKRLAADKETLKAEQISLAEIDAKSQVEQEISKLKSQQAKTQAAYNAALGANPFSLAKVLSLTTEAEEVAKELATAEKIYSSEFGN